MKRVFVFFLLLALISCSTQGPARRKARAPVEVDPISERIEKEQDSRVPLAPAAGVVPSAEEFFQQLRITVEAPESEQFILGDNIAGYYEGYTHNYRLNEGYKMKNMVLLKNYATFYNGSLNNRMDAAVREHVYPMASRVEYPKGISEELTMLSGEYAMAVTIRAEEPGILAAVPMLNTSARFYAYEPAGDSMLLRRENAGERDYPQFIAIQADQAYDFQLAVEGAYTDVADVLKLEPQQLPGVVASAEPTTEMTVYYAFGFSAEEALEKADRLAGQDGVTQAWNRTYDRLTRSYLETSDEQYNKASLWAKASAYSMVAEEFGKGIWAGLPWFKDNWGRDTFIALPGTLLVAGLFDDAREVLDNFADLQNLGYPQLRIQVAEDIPLAELQGDIRDFLNDDYAGNLRREGNQMTLNLIRKYLDARDEAAGIAGELQDSLAPDYPDIQVQFRVVQDEQYGRIPNRVTSLDNIIYNTTDGTPWMIREIYEYLRYTGNTDYAESIYPMVSTAIRGAIENYVDDEGLLTHEAADTWMDAKIAGELPWSDRGTRAVEIQALWITSLRAGARLAEMNGDDASAREWRQRAEQAEQSFAERFWNAEAGRMADRIRKDDTADEKIRPNQYMVISVPFDNQIVDDGVEARLIADSFSHIVYPYGVASLDQDHEYFHPLHENHSYHHKDAAYHNGTIWGWNAGFVVTALAKYGYQHRAYELSSSLADQILNYGTRGSMSENLDALLNDDGDINLTGTYSQAWSVSEYARNTYQDYLGFRPNLLENRLELTPAIPAEWGEFDARVPFGNGESMEIRYSQDQDSSVYLLRLSGESPAQTLRFQPLDNAGARYRAEIELAPGQEIELRWDSASDNLMHNGSSAAVERIQDSYRDVLGELPFQTSLPYRPEDFSMLEGRNTLQVIIEAGEYR